MRNLIGYCLFIIFTLLLTGCAGVEKEKSPLNTQITIESYNMSEKEKLLISKTGVGQIEFFKLYGTPKEDEKLQFSVEVFKNGKFKEELLRTWDGPETKYQDSFISFGISGIENEGHSLKLITGTPSGLSSTFYSNNMTSSSFSKLVGEKVTLEKDKPVYLAAWLGTTKNELSSGGGENGELPSGIEEAELAILYKVLWNDKEKNSEEITFYKLDTDPKQIVLTDKDTIKTIKKIIKGAIKQPGIVDMTDPQYKINLGDEIYLLWLTRSGGTIGTIMNGEDTHTIYTLSESLTKELNDILHENKLK